MVESNTKLATANQQINSELAIVKMVNSTPEKRMTDLEKKQAKSEQYNRRNNVEFSNIPNDIPDNQLESKIIQICRESGVEVDHNDIEGCHRLPVSRYIPDDNKRVIAKFVNRKHSESLLYKKKFISSKDFSNINIPSKIFLSVSLCPYYRFIWGKCKDLQRRGKIHQVFCLGGTVSVKLSDIRNSVKIYHVADIPTFNDDNE